MPNLLQELQNNEAVLLMYVTDELPDEDRAEVEQMLASDASLRAELEEVRLALASSSSAMASLDRLTRLPVKRDAALRQVNRLMARWNVERLAKVPVPVPVKGLIFPWWSYPLATAASVMLAFLVFWGNRDDSITVRFRDDPVLAFGPDNPFEQTDESDAMELADQLVLSFDGTDPLLGNAGSTILLADAEDQFAALASSTEEILSLNVIETMQ